MVPRHSRDVSTCNNTTTSVLYYSHVPRQAAAIAMFSIHSGPSATLASLLVHVNMKDLENDVCRDNIRLLML